MLRSHGLLALTGGLLALLLGASGQQQQQWGQQQGQQQWGGGGDWARGGGSGDHGGPQDLSAFPTFNPQGGARADGGLVPLGVRPALKVTYDIFLNFSSQMPWAQEQQVATKAFGEGGLQLFKISVLNEGPGDVVQLATKIEGWNDTTSWWGLDTLDGNNTYAYLPKYRSPLRPGDTWTFGMIQQTNRSTFPLVEPLYGQTGDGHFFNLTSIIPSPANPSGTNATLMVKDQRESFYRGQRFVLFDGRITNSGNYPLVNVGLDIENITQATGTWHLIYDPATNTSYLPLRQGPLRAGASQDFGFVMPLEGSSFPNVSLHQVTTPNALYSITAPNLFNEERPREMLPPRNGTTTTLEQSEGGLVVPYPPVHGRARGQGQGAQQQQQPQQQVQPQQPQQQQQQPQQQQPTQQPAQQEQRCGGEPQQAQPQQEQQPQPEQQAQMGGDNATTVKYLNGRPSGRRRVLRDY